MQLTKKINLVSKNGMSVEVEIERTKELQDDISYADGWNINLGKKTVDSIYIKVFVNGKLKTSDYCAPWTITEKDLIAKGAYARVGDIYLGKNNYDTIMAAIEEMDTELVTTDEYEEVKTEEIAKEARVAAAEKAAEEHYEKLIASGMCPKCKSWCYGDCER